MYNFHRSSWIRQVKTGWGRIVLFIYLYMQLYILYEIFDNVIHTQVETACSNPPAHVQTQTTNRNLLTQLNPLTSWAQIKQNPSMLYPRKNATLIELLSLLNHSYFSLCFKYKHPSSIFDKLGAQCFQAHSLALISLILSRPELYKLKSKAKLVFPWVKFNRSAFTIKLEFHLTFWVLLRLKLPLMLVLGPF